MLPSVLSFRPISSSLPFTLCAREWTLSLVLHLLMLSLKVPPSFLFVSVREVLHLPSPLFQSTMDWMYLISDPRYCQPCGWSLLFPSWKLVLLKPLPRFPHVTWHHPCAAALFLFLLLWGCRVLSGILIYSSHFLSSRVVFGGTSYHLCFLRFFLESFFTILLCAGQTSTAQE